MQYTISELKRVIYQKVYEVYDIFKDFFGEDSVDLQNLVDDDSLFNAVSAAGIELHNPSNHFVLSETQFQYIKESCRGSYSFILVYWPRVIVTNEYDKSIEIQDLYAKITLDLEGRIPYESHGFYLNRARYNYEQFASNYMHSHICSIPKNNLTEFQSPCLGRGPIRDTISSLRNEFDETIWMLFCQELSMYVTVESITGVPYNKLENVGRYSIISEYKNYTLNLGTPDRFRDCFATDSDKELKKFIKFYLKKGHLKFSYKDNSFVPSLSCFDYMLDISNAFIEFYNRVERRSTQLKEKLFRYSVLESVVVRNRNFCSPNNRSSNADYSLYIGRKVCEFKGRDITLQIDMIHNTEVTPTTILNHSLAMFILKEILNIINYRYTNGINNNRNQQSSESASAGKKILFVA